MGIGAEAPFVDCALRELSRQRATGGGPFQGIRRERRDELRSLDDLEASCLANVVRNPRAIEIRRHDVIETRLRDVLEVSYAEDMNCVSKGAPR
ncbi:MAG: hypothetical protein EDS66_03280 [Planctomycetota bacterium]|nr:MAG: hypothetical protein EDS66_03280 [Planctomycetota bacterium]MCQ3920060.1 hypothetical protein [Planctomycetota bacterium]